MRFGWPLISLVALCQTIVGEAYTADGCPDGWLHSDGLCYLYRDISLSHSLCQQECVNVGANLASIWSVEEETFIDTHVLTKLPLPAMLAWIGLYHDNIKWKNSDGTTYNYVLPWASGAPVNVTGACAALDGQGKMSDTSCGTVTSACICKKAALIIYHVGTPPGLAPYNVTSMKQFKEDKHAAFFYKSTDIDAALSDIDLNTNLQSASPMQCGLMCLHTYNCQSFFAQCNYNTYCRLQDCYLGI